MKIAVDLDGVCYEWDRTARYMLRTYRGQAHLTGESDHWDSIQHDVSKEDWKWLWAEGVALGLFRYGHMTVGTRVALQELTAKGHGIEIVTHRPHHAVNDTLDWLSLYMKDIPLRGVRILSAGESKCVSDAEVLIDDKPANTTEWYESGRTALLFDRPWNQQAVTVGGFLGKQAMIVRTHGWGRVVNLVNSL